MADRPGEPIDTARTVLLMVSDDSFFVWSQNLFMDGGVMATDVGSCAPPSPAARTDITRAQKPGRAWRADPASAVRDPGVRLLPPFVDSALATRRTGWTR